MVDKVKIWLVSQKLERGQDLAEYALLLGLIALIVVLAITLLGRNFSDVFSEIGSAIGTWL